MAYVEVKAKTVEMAIEAAMRELGVTERDRLDIEVLQEPERGFFGFGGQDAIVKVSERSGGKRSRSRNRSRSKATQTKSESPASQPAPNPKNPDRQRQSGGGNRPGNGRSRSASGSGSDKVKAKVDDRDALGTEGQEPLVRGFLEGLLESFGLEGSVETRIDEDVIVANVVGEQTEALVGPRGSVMEAVHELTKTVLQRTAQDPARVRIDIAGYAERRRQALTIYAGDLIKQVQGEGGELMLEPMSASDRKVIHDAVAAHDGVRSYSEGEAPGRYVVIAAAEEGSAAEES
ncbi:MAG TPA: RNA-binding cell elongation regulator Jag/EloR [Acidimicrobiia bacterium]|nr:RNA-binding cell elongation regulator Jag/EloR [Acidimicrobiia bacterium]